MTGQNAAFGEQLRRGAEMAVKDINAKGGVLGQQLKLAVGDDVCDPKQAVAVANKLAKDGAKFVAGHYCSSSSIPASDVYHEEGVIQMSPGSTNPKLTDRGLENVFRVCGRDDQQGVVAGKYLSETYKGKNIAILHDKSAYGQGLAEETKKALNAAGQTEKLFEAYTPGEKDYSSLVTKLKQLGVDAVYVGGYHTEAGLIARQMGRPGHGAADRLRRRVGHQRVLGDHRGRRRGHDDDLRPGSARRGGRRRPSSTSSVPAVTSRRATPPTPTPRSRSTRRRPPRPARSTWTRC